MNRRVLIRTIAVLGLIACIGLFAAPISPLSWHSPAAVEANSPPEFPSGTTTRDVDENTPPFQNIGEPVTATDADNDRLVYSLQNAHTSPFTIVRATGQLQVGQPLDYETKNSYDVKVIVTDTSGTKDTITITITVNNVEEPGKVTLTWTRPQVGAEITASLTDPDGSISSAIWQWDYFSSQNGLYTELSGNGADSDTYTPQSDDVGKYLRATASYTDGHDSVNKAQAVSATPVRVGPDDNEAPVFTVHTSGGYACGGNGFEDETEFDEDGTAKVCLWVPRSRPAGSDIYYPGHATDSDHHEFRYSLGGMDAQLFTIDPSRGTLFSKEAHAYDNPENGKFEITIIVTDPSTGSDSIEVVLKPSGGAGSPVVKGPERIVYPENGTWPLATYSATASNSAGETRGIHGWIISVQPGGGDGDFFDIDDDGVLTFTQPPDYEDPADENGDRVYNFQLHVYDTNPPNRGRPAQTFFPVRVTVVDVEVEALEILGPSAVEYSENRTDSVATYRLEGGSGLFKWFLSGADAGAFSLSQGGELTFNIPPDYENPTDVAEENAYLVTITADREGASKTEFIRVKVTNVNEPPEFDEGKTATRSVTRDAEANALIGEPVAATDPDEDGLTYTLPDAQTLPFSISEYIGQLSLSGALLQDRSSYTVVVLVTDGQDAAGDPDTSEDDRITVTINVEGDGNSAPEFLSTETFARSFPENSTGGQNVGGPVTATDGDNDRLIYTLGGTDAADFQILGTTGQIQTKAGVTYDYEDKSSYSVTVTANDGNGGTVTQEVTITVTDVDEPPAFTDGLTTVEYAENDTGDVASYSTEDPEDATIHWTLEGADEGLLSIDANGNLTFDSPPNFEAKASDDGDNDYQVTVQATAGTDTVTLNVTVTVTDVNEAPTFPGPTATRSVVENTAPGENIGTPVEADDPDADASLTYTLGGADASHFDIVATSGQLQTSGALDKETEDTYYVTVSVKDSKDDNGDADTATDDSIDVTITVTGENDAPTITGGPTAVTDYAENSESNVGAYTATDPEGDNIAWSLSGADSGDFDISIGGVLTFKSLPNFEFPDDANTNNEYLVTVVASDGGKSDSRAVTVTVTNVNEKPEFGSETASRSVAENTGSGVDIGAAVAATDPDADAPFNTLTYTLTGDDAGYFDIVTTSGQLQTKGVLDLETKASYTVIVSVRDSLNDSGTVDIETDDTVTVTIIVTDENDPPVITGGPATNARDYAENDDSVVATYTATDPESDVITWSAAGADGSVFSISGGVLTFVDPPNFEARADTDNNNIYLVTVRAVDGPNTVTRALAVTVTDVNEPPAFPSTETGRRSVAEGTSAGQDIGSRVAASDPEGDDLTYSVTGADAAAFDVDTSTGQLRTKNALDSDTKDTYSFIVEVRDSKDADGNTDALTDATKAVEITVTGVNEAPVISGDSTPSHAENDAGPVATYADNDPEQADITWSLSGADGGDFRISSTGELTFTSPPDFETPADEDRNNIYLVTLTADDGTHTDTFEVTVTVTNVNEPPFFPAATAIRSVPENTPADQNIGLPVMARDWDTDATFGTLTHTLSGTDDSSFDFDTATGHLKTKVALDHEAKDSYTVTVSVTDGKDAAGNADDTADDTVTVTISVTDVNDAPVITGPTTVLYAENATSGVATYTATDQDSGDTVTWRLLSGEDAASLSLSPMGVLRFNDPPDYEDPKDADQNKEYRVVVEAFDETVTTAYHVTITITNVDEAGAVTFDSLQPQVSTALTANIEDPDGGVSSAAWQWQTFENPITKWADIAGATQQAYMPVEADVGKYLRATASYTDAEGSGKSAQGLVTAVRAAPLQNAAPVFADDTATRAVPENSVVGTNVGDPVTATDSNSDDTLTYSVEVTDTDSFSINQSTGQLRTEAVLDEETKNTYSVTVKATDPSGESDTIAVTIMVTDQNEGPSVARTGRVSYPENGTVDIAEYTAKDPEGVTIIWSVTGTDSGRFSVDASVVGSNSVAVLTFKTVPDFEAPADSDGNNVYLVTVVASDGTNSNSTEVIVTVTNVNEPPEFPASETGARSFPENSGAGENVGDPVAATDEDDDNLTYTLGGTDTASFQILGTGQIQTKSGQTYDHEIKSKYSVTVTANDGNGGTDTQEVTITVDNVEEPGTVTLSTNQPSARTAITASLTDLDGGVTGTTWQWQKSNTFQGAYNDIVDATSASYTPADADVGAYLRATASYTDGHDPGKTAQATTTQAVRAGENRPPEFSAASDTRSFAENTAAGENIGPPVTATDPDTSDSLTYTLEGTDADSFQIVSTSGQIQTKSGQTYDYESNKKTYSVTVKATDTENASATKDVTITVDNVEEPGTITLSTNPASARVPITASLTDPDGGVTGTSWQWQKSNTFQGAYSNINGATSDTYTPVDADVGAYLRATASYTDGHDPGKTAQATTTQAVQAGTNRPPEFSPNTATRSFAENTTAGQPIGDPVTATDLDNNSLTYTLEGTDKDSFQIVSTSGQIQTKSGQTYDYESNKKTYSVTVKATDTSDASATIAVTITVDNVDEPGTVTLSSVQPQVDTPLTATLTDPDVAVDSTVTWQWARSDAQDSGYDDITTATSASYTPVDDVDKFLRATAIYTDGHGPGKTAQGVSDNAVQTAPVNNAAPEFDPDTASRDIAETDDAGENIGDPVAATDLNDDTLTYTLADTDDGASFSIVRETGQLQTRDPLDYESEKKTYTVTVTATDPSNASATITVTINVIDVDEAPEFGFVSSIYYAENRTDRIATYTATDPEKQAITWKLSGEDKDLFEISSTAGELTFKASPNYEDPTDANTDNEYEVIVQAYDGAETGELRQTITITNVDEPGTVTLSANPGSARVEITATLEDIDGGVTGTSWQWQKSSDGRTGWANVGTNSNTYTPPDADVGNYLQATASYTDAQGGGKTAQATTTQGVQAGTNRPPEFSAITATRSFAENTTAGQPIGDPVTATDPDNNSLTYTLEGTDADSFQIVSTSGQIQTKSGQTYDYESAKKTYTVTVKADDNNGGTDTITVTITVTDQDDLPEITGGSTSVSYAENGTGDVETYTATDLDSSSLTWDLSGDDELLFSIGTTSGILTFKDPPNYEAPKDKDGQNDYQVTVEVSDGPNTATRDVTVNVTGVNEAPAFPSTETGRRSVEEGTSPGQDIGAPVAAVDPEGDTLTYSVTGADAAAFTFDTSTGQLQTKKALDADDKASYSFTVSVTDNKQADGTADSAIDASKTVEITVTDVDEPPAISGDSSPQHAENDTGVVGIYADNDPEDASITWTLSGDDRGDFLISETGELTFKNTPDFETPVDKDKNNIYLVTLTADDGTNTDTFDVIVTIENVNEPPFFPAATAARSVPENTPVGQNIGLPVAARDWDADTTLEYTLGGADDSSFDFDRSTGQLKTKVALDHESRASYTVTVSVTDGEDAAGSTDDAVDDSVTVTINVTGANDPPVISGSSTLTYDENATSDVATYTATDQDVGDTVSWRLSGPDGSGLDNHGLSISSTGVLMFSSPPNFEDPKDKGDANGAGEKDNEYLVTVEAFDGTATTTLDVTITVSNVDEAGELTFLALQPQEGTELTAKIVDPDGSVSPTTWKWEISDDGSTGWTAISGATSASYTPVDTDVGKYLRVTVTYTDALTTSKNLTAMNANAVQAVPETNTAPEFAGETTARSVGENAPVGTNVGTPVTASDSNTDDTLTYSLGDVADSTDAASFTINQSSGQLRTGVTLDRETKSTYTVTVTATDPSGESDTITVTITVTDQNEAPVLARTDRISYPENSAVDIAEYTATDPEGVTIIWSVTGTDSARFSVANGVVTFEVAPDFEAPTDSDENNVYLVTVVASDGTNSDATDVIVTVTNVNEEPAFPSTENGQRTVAEDTGTGQYIGSPVAARDPDAGDSLTYTLGGADAASFDIVSSTGQLQTKSALEYDTQSRYTVSVTATDTADNSVTIAVAIVVTEVVEAPAPPPPPPPQQRPVPPPPVQRAPTTKPTIDSVTPGNRSLTVAWSAPGDTDGQTITSYDMRHIKSSVVNPEDSDWIVAEDVWTTSGDLVYDLIGLDNNAEYNVQVRAGYLVDAGPWSDSETGTPTAGTESDDGCRLTLGSPSGTVTQTGTWTSDCDSVNRIGSYALFYTFTLKQEAELQIDLTSSEDTYLFLLNGAGTDGAVAASNDDVVVTEDVNSRISTTLAAGAYTIEATTYAPRITGDFTVTITVAGGDGSAVGPPGGTQPPGTTPPGGQQPQPPGMTPPGGQQPPAQVGPADAPTITSVTPGTETLTVAWEAPSDTGSSEITAYDLRHIRSSVTERADSDWIVLEDVWSDSGSLEYQLTGLTDNIGYDIQVRASYAIGSGSWSLPASGTPGTTGSPSTGTPTGDACHVNLKTLTTNVELTGTWVSDCESVNREGRYARFYSFTLGQAGQVQIDLTSTQDPYLFLLEGGTTDGKVVVENDDVVVNENTNSRIVTTLAAGAHTIEATTYHTAQTGEFSLTISLPQGSGGSGGSPPGSSGPGSPSEDGCEVDLNVLTSRVSRTGHWAFDCDSTNRAGRYARYYTFTLRQEAELQIDVVSTEDPFAFLLEGAGKDGEVLAKNDDVAAGTDLNSRISATLAAGRYTIEATTYSEEVAGEFTLTIAFTEAVEDIPDPCVTPLETPTGVVTQTGTWADDCQSTNRIGTYARFYSFTLEQEAEVQIDLMSSHDPFLFLLHGDGRDGTLVAQNDDVTVNVDLNSRISMILDAGVYTIEATTYNTWDTGDFTLTIAGPEGASALQTDDCVEDLGTPSNVVTKTGTWTDACDSTSREGQYARFYTFTLEQQSEVQIDLVSTQDPYLFLLQGTGTNGAEVASNDDIVPNVELDSLISVTLAAGSYTIEATTYDVGETGAFTLTLTP